MERFRKSFSDYSSLAVITAVLICFLLMKDTGTAAAIRWLAAVFSISFFLRPLFPSGCLKFPDGGFALSFGTGLFLCFYLAWTLSALGICRFADPIVYISFAVLAVAAFFLRKISGNSEQAIKDDLKSLLRGFAVFSVIFLAFFWIIGFNPGVDPGTENYMDFGFMQAIWRQKAAFPNDIWFAGEKLNYYYLGQAAAVYMCRLAGTTPEFGYNLMLSTFAGSVFLMVFEIVSGVAASFTGEDGNGRSSVLGGLAGAVLAAFGANGHWIVFGVLLSGVQKLLGTSPSAAYWFSDGTVYINTEAGDADNGKNEFPAYSVILGDLHAHVINLIFVLPLIAVLFGMCAEREEDRDIKRSIRPLILISMLLGFFKGSNYWDFAIYYVICGAVIVFSDLKKYGAGLKALLAIGIKAAAVTALSVAFILPFTLSFTKMESGIGLCSRHSPAGKLAVLWLIPACAGAALLICLFRERRNDRVNHACSLCLTAFTLCTMGLVAVPEVIYVKDIYEGDNSRFNTMFKLTYQAYVLFAVIVGILLSYILWRIGHGAKRGVMAAVCIAAYTLLAAGYMPYSVHQWFGNVFDAGMRSGISSLECLRPDGLYGFELRAADLIMEDERENINIVEASGPSYSHESALSVYTGTCTPAGWFVHEWMWHNNPEPIRERADRVSYFYTSGDEEYCRNFIKLYDIDYILVGPAEISHYPVNRNGFWRLGDACIDEVFGDCELALIKVDRSRL
ncbi:MAG: hypothetical protein K6G58_08290 [Lachnospiraceae bacterium]|nr:hypothetical protein [Lachnospiraceae bacterium]